MTKDEEGIGSPVLGQSSSTRGSALRYERAGGRRFKRKEPRLRRVNFAAVPAAAKHFVVDNG